MYLKKGWKQQYFCAQCGSHLLTLLTVIENASYITECYSNRFRSRGFCGLPLVPIILLKGSPADGFLLPCSLSPLVPDFRETSAVRKTNLWFWVARFLSMARYFILMCLWIHHKISFAHWMPKIICNKSKKKKKKTLGGGVLCIGGDLARLQLWWGNRRKGEGCIHPSTPCPIPPSFIIHSSDIQQLAAGFTSFLKCIYFLKLKSRQRIKKKKKPSTWCLCLNMS